MNTRFFPAEWAPQKAVMLTWPHSGNDWSAQLGEVEPVFVAIATEVLKRQGLLVTCRDATHAQHIRALLQTVGANVSQLRLGLADSNDVWARDHGPISVVGNGQPTLLDFQFNGWGNKYRHDRDNRITEQLHAQGLFAPRERISVPLVLEGGGIETDGQGTLLTTRSCLLARSRNPDLSQAQLEAQLAETLGIDRLLWLSHGHLAGDDTDGHIDTLARFCDPQTIAYVHCDDPSDAHYPELLAMQAELGSFCQKNGQPYHLIPLPLPQPQHDASGKRLPATHANFLIINDAVLVPTYADAADAIALARLAEAFPNREIVGIDCRALIQQYGSLHCVTMQIPL